MRNIEMIPIAMLESHPDNPRKDLGDLTELTASIRQNGIYQNLTVVQKIDKIVTTTDEKLADMHIKNCEDPDERKWLEELREKGLWISSYKHIIVIGHRRLAAAKKAGLEKVPCAVVRMSPQKQIETMILENMQRADLTVYEQVKGFQQLLDLGDSIEGIAKKTGFSEKTIKRRTEIARLDPDKLERIMEGRGKQLTLEEFDKLASIKDLKTRNKLLEEIGTRNFDYVVAAAKAAEKTKEMLPKVLTWIDGLPCKKKKITESDAWGYDLLTMYPGIEIKTWKTGKEKAEAVLEKLPEGETLYYAITEGGYLKLCKKQKVKKVKEKSAAEIKKEKEMSAAWDYLIEQSRLAYELREKFIKDFEVTKSNYDKVIEGALLAAINNELSYSDGDDDKLEELLEVNGKEYKAAGGDKKAVGAIKNLDFGKHGIIKRLPQIIWALFNDSPELICEEHMWDECWPEFDEDRSDVLALYKWLEGLGYQISEVERSLIEGTDNHYHLGDAEKEAAK